MATMDVGGPYRSRFGSIAKRFQRGAVLGRAGSMSFITSARCTAPATNTSTARNLLLYEVAASRRVPLKWRKGFYEFNTVFCAGRPCCAGADRCSVRLPRTGPAPGLTTKPTARRNRTSTRAGVN